jgi:hypothetical protein
MPFNRPTWLVWAVRVLVLLLAACGVLLLAFLFVWVFLSTGGGYSSY